MQQQGLTTDDYYTPKWLFDKLNITFDIDVASPPNGPIYTPCKSYYSQIDDGLTAPWFGTVFMNPPYSSPTAWVAKYLQHANGIALLPFTKSKWFDSLWNHDLTVMAYIRVIKFDRPEKQMNNQTPFALSLWAVGDKSIFALEKSGLGKTR